MNIEMDLSVKSVEKAIEQLKQYKKELIKKNNLFVERLAEVGIPVINQAMSSGKGDSSRAHSTSIVITGSGNTVDGKLILEGEDILFWEFGAGIRYNNGNANPKASEFGMGVGTYPGQTHAITPGYWWYSDEDKKKHLSFGTEATMPMYKASLEIIEKVNQIAREVFGSGK